MTKLATIAILLALATSANAGVPDPRMSTVPTCWTFDPSGDLSVTVTVRDVNNAPVANSTVWIDLCTCPSIHLCPPSPEDGYTVVGCTVKKVTNAAGQATFALRGGGGCAGSAPFFADGVLLANVTTIASPDQDGNLVVNAADVALLAAKHGSSDRTGDLTCNGNVDEADDAVQVAHLGHACANQTPTLPTSWGHVRSLYR